MQMKTQQENLPKVKWDNQAVESELPTLSLPGVHIRGRRGATSGRAETNITGNGEVRQDETRVTVNGAAAEIVYETLHCQRVVDTDLRV